jgi:hypothetical protein
MLKKSEIEMLAEADERELVREVQVRKKKKKEKREAKRNETKP